MIHLYCVAQSEPKDRLGSMFGPVTSVQEKPTFRSISNMELFKSWKCSERRNRIVVEKFQVRCSRKGSLFNCLKAPRLLNEKILSDGVSGTRVYINAVHLLLHIRHLISAPMLRNSPHARDCVTEYTLFVPDPVHASTRPPKSKFSNSISSIQDIAKLSRCFKKGNLQAGGAWFSALGLEFPDKLWTLYTHGYTHHVNRNFGIRAFVSPCMRCSSSWNSMSDYETKVAFALP